MGCGEIAEHKLCQPFFPAPLPYPIDVLHTGVDLALVVVGQHTIHKALVQRQLSAIVCDLEHIIDSRIHHAVAYPLGAFRKKDDHLLLMRRGLHGYIVVADCWNGKVQHIGSLDVRCLLEHGYQLGQVVEPRKPRLCPITRTLGRQLNGGDGFAKGRRPCVEVRQVVFLQEAVLQVALHGVQLSHAIGYRSTRGKYNAAPVR